VKLQQPSPQRGSWNTTTKKRITNHYFFNWFQIIEPKLDLGLQSCPPPINITIEKKTRQKNIISNDKKKKLKQNIQQKKVKK
jgi:hypothetical protein